MFCATARELEGKGGMYFNHCQLCEASDEANNDELAVALWHHSDSMVKEYLSRHTL